MADYIWREDTTDTTHGTVVKYSLWDRETNKRLGGVTQIEQRPNGDFMTIDVVGVVLPEDAKIEFNSMDDAKSAVLSHIH